MSEDNSAIVGISSFTVSVQDLGRRHYQGGDIMRNGMNGLVVAGVMLAMVGCSEMGGMMKASTPSLYDRLGQKPAIEAVVSDFVARVAADNRINGKFAQANIPRLKMLLVEQICEASGGPFKYSGRDMKKTHAGMAVTEPQFNALVEDLVSTFNKFKVGEKEKSELLGVLGPMKKDIVTAM